MVSTLRYLLPRLGVLAVSILLAGSVAVAATPRAAGPEPRLGEWGTPDGSTLHVRVQRVKIETQIFDGGPATVMREDYFRLADFRWSNRVVGRCNPRFGHVRIGSGGEFHAEDDHGTMLQGKVVNATTIRLELSGCRGAPQTELHPGA